MAWRAFRLLITQRFRESVVFKAKETTDALDLLFVMRDSKEVTSATQGIRHCIDAFFRKNNFA